jgi:tetratricopeptide (TPR) repeat protein
MWSVREWLLVLLFLSLAGCVTAQRRGEQALYAGQYDEAIQIFQATLAEHPDRLDARLGLGIALYKAGALSDAAVTLDEVLALAPAAGPALFYRGLIAIQQREDEAAAGFLARFGNVARIPRFEAQLERALRVLRGPEPLSADMREFMSTSLEDAVRSAREVEQARLAAQRAYLSVFPPVRCSPTRHGWICF